jgi:hypothetical protein
LITRQKAPTRHSLVSNEECPATGSTYSYQNEKRDFTKQARKALLISKALTRAPEIEIKLQFRLDRYLLTTFLIERGKCAQATYLTNKNEGPYRWVGVAL